METKNQTTVAVFDLDNTLIDSQAKLNSDTVQAFARLGISLTPAQVGKDWYKTAENYEISKERFDESFDKRKSWEESLKDGEVPIFQDTYQTLENLKQRGIRLALLSKSIPAFTQVKLDYFGLTKYFEDIATIHPKEPSKDPAAIEVIRRMSPERIAQAYFIGDKAEDITCERAVREKYKDYELNTSGIYVSRNGSSLTGYPNIKSLDEVVSIIENGK